MAQQRYAQLSGDRIVLVIETEDAPAGEWVPCGIASMGWLRRSDGTFAPDDTAVPAPPAIVSRKAFLSRFNEDEAVDIDLASMGATRQAASVRRYLAKTDAAQHIDLADPETQYGVHALEAAGLIGAGRALQILTSPIQPKELP